MTGMARVRTDEVWTRMDRVTEEERIMWEALEELLSLSPAWARSLSLASGRIHGRRSNLTHDQDGGCWARGQDQC